MPEISSNNKRIAKNTLMLYVRMFLMTGVSLYTSRVVLAALGVSDYGVYSVVGGIVTMFGFLNGAMSSATQRYITFALGKGDKERLSKVFSTTMQVHALMALVVVVLGEIVGLWFLYNKMQLPPDRITAAFWVLQCSIVSTVIMMVSVPYNADIIAHEKMSAFAYLSIADGALRLGIVYLLVISPIDKLTTYALLVVAVQIFMWFCYRLYCHRHFKESFYTRVREKTLFRELLSFSGWSVFGNLAGALFGQGLNLLLNIFFGPVVNAARAIALQVQTGLQQFVSNFQMALNPQITKTYAQDNLDDMRHLVYRSARFSFFLLFMLALPVVLEAPMILSVWLKVVPPDTVIFVRLMICIALIYTLAGPLIAANQATGKVKVYQAVCGGILLLILPISYVCLKLGMPAYSVFIVHFIMEGCCQVARMIILKPMIGISIRDYLRRIYAPIALVVLSSIALPCFLYFSLDGGWLRLAAVCASSVLSVSVMALTLGMEKGERGFVVAKALQIIHGTKK